MGIEIWLSLQKKGFSMYLWKLVKIISNYSVIDQLSVYLTFIHGSASPLIHCDHPNVYVSNRQMFYKYVILSMCQFSEWDGEWVSLVHS